MPTPTPSQRAAIEADLQPLLVVAGPGSGKTFCLIERIRFLIEKLGIAPERICAFTFTNKAAEEIANRLAQLGPAAALVRRTTIHKLCVDLLREHGARVGVPQGFGIADDEYQMQVLWRLESNPAKRNGLPKRFSLYRLRGEELFRETATRLEQYEQILKKHNLLDFDMLLLKARELLLVPEVADAVRARWDAVLVDEFQDLNPVQYAVIKALAVKHRNVFAVGDFDQSIYGWAGAEPKVFSDYVNDFAIKPHETFSLLENRRVPKNVFALARAFVDVNPMLPGLGGRPEIIADKHSDFAVEAVGFDDHDAEVAWIIDDIRRQRVEHHLRWGDFALLYRKHEIGNLAEPAMLTADIPCRLAHGRAVAEDPIVRYLASALRIIADPNEDIHKEAFLQLVLPRTFRDVVKAEAEANCETPIDRLKRLGRELPHDDENARKLRRAFWTMRNFAALGRRHTDLEQLAAELLSQRVGEYKTALEREHLLIVDPELSREASALAFRIKSAMEHDRPVVLPRAGGAEIAMKAILHGIGVRTVRIGSGAEDTIAVSGTKWVVQRSDAEVLTREDGGAMGLPLAVFKAGQILASRKFAETFRDYVAFDLETTGRDADSCHVVDIAAVRVRDGKIVDEFSTLVNPGVPIPPDATATHHVTDAMVANAPSFAEVWPKFRAFCGNDVVVAHNGYTFDFRIINRLAGGLNGLGTYDTLPLARELVPSSRRLEDLARKYEVDTGQSHRALDDSRALAKIFLRLNQDAVARARKTALVHLLDHLGVALALTGPHPEASEQQLLLGLAIPYALGGFSDCLEHYRAMRDELNDPTLPTVEFVIDALGGPKRMQQVRREKSADDRYPISMERIRRLLQGLGARDEGLGKPLDSSAPSASEPSASSAVSFALKSQIDLFLERVALSIADGPVAERDRVNLLTLHSTKGLEFSRVYILGVEDAQFLMGERPTKPEIEEARRLLYVGMTRTKDRLVLTRCENRGGRLTGGTQFLDEMGLVTQAIRM